MKKFKHSYVHINFIIFFILLQIITQCALYDQCVSTPFWKLNLCEINCESCNSNSLCTNCSQYYQLSNNKQCTPDSTYIYNQTLFTSPSIDTSTITMMPFTYKSKNLDMTKITRVCLPSSYKFDMLGLFGQTSSLIYTLQKSSFQKQIIQIRIEFNFISIYQNVSVKMILDNTEIYDKKYQELSVLNNTLEVANQTTKINYIKIPALQYSSSNALIKKIDSGFYTLENADTKQSHILQIIVIYRSDTTNTSQFWALSDFSLTAKKCQDCIPTSLNELSKNIAIAIGITTAALIILILILYLCTKYEERQRRMSFEKKSKEEILKNVETQNLMNSYIGVHQEISRTKISQKLKKSKSK